MGQTIILWVAPNLNHYKIRFINKLLSLYPGLRVTVLTGEDCQKEGHLLDDSVVPTFPVNRISVSKKWFGFSWKVIREILQASNESSTILLPYEKKNIFLLITLKCWTFFTQKSNLEIVTLNHPMSKTKGRVTALDRTLTAFAYGLYNKVIFYTEQSKIDAINEKVISPEKAFHANNTIDTSTIKRSANLPAFDKPTLLFIGRLTEGKKVLELFDYFEKLKAEFLTLRLHIVGDGPLKEVVERKVKNYSGITYHGGIVDEQRLAPIFQDSHLFILPGEAGLAIVHSFAYGKPFVTFSNPNHGPELSYLEHGKNGLLLSSSFEENVEQIGRLLSDSSQFKKMSLHAHQSADKYSIEAWAAQMHHALTA